MLLLKKLVFSIFGILFLIVAVKCEDDIYMCDSSNSKNWQIYCSGRILETFNYHQICNDSKDFVDKPLVYSPEETIQNFTKWFGNSTSEEIDRDVFIAFMNKSFEEAGHELKGCLPDGFIEYPPKLASIRDKDMREFAFALHKVWKELCKEMDEKVSKNPERYSLLPLKHKFIAPGGRFREPYYWDAYWIIKGLMASELYDAAKQMIYNFADYINTFGFIPNGGRVYYLQRSQPPLFIPMIYEIYEATGNETFVQEMLPTMIKEFEYWRKNHQYNITLGNKTHTVYQYRAGSNTPRPESYKEDLKTAAEANLTSKSDQHKLFRNLASAAESGLDFSTRWFADKKNLETIETTNILPVDLNSFLCWNANILAYLFDKVSNDQAMYQKYHHILKEHRHAIQNVFFNKTEKMWLDYNIRTKSHNPTFYATLATPLFTNCYNSLDQGKAEDVFLFFNRSHAFDYPGGVPSSMVRDTGEQWDFPNGWGNVNHMIIEGLRKSEAPQAQDVAFSLATRWVRENFKVFKHTNHMWEKYDVAGTIPEPGSGGEYQVQKGFGWTNGAILDLLVTYGDRITAYDKPPPKANDGNIFNVSICALIFSVLLAV